MFQTAQDGFDWNNNIWNLSNQKNILKPIVCIYKSIDFNTHNKQILYGHVEYIYQPFERGIQYKHACFTSTVPRSAHSKRDILQLHISISIQNNQLR